MGIRLGHAAAKKPDGNHPNGWYSYICGHCGRDVAGIVVAFASDEGADHIIRVRWLQCPSCRQGSVFSKESVFPGSVFGPMIEGLPTEVKQAYDEARRCLSVNAYTAAEGLCRKILMHVAVDKGAVAGQTFASYIDYLEQSGYVTPPMKDWVKLIKNHGNESQHQLKSPEQKRAQGTLLFTAQLLRSVYEMEHLASQFQPQPPPTP
jgi:DNA-directed RNA polymerase subunit RPC12/RpoP